MEGTPLRSVPTRLPGPLDSSHALAQVELTLPGLQPELRRALALVDLAERPRAEAAGELGVAADELSRALAAARKALRQTLVAVPSGGWCERAERLISDGMDDALTDAGRRRLDAHLRGCERCATHERKLVQAHDQLIARCARGQAPGGAVALPAATVTELRLVDSAASDGRWPTLPLGWRVALILAVLLVFALVAIVLLATGAIDVH
ncbi:MAG TPA: zf-HC2 domain-containing protein [Thermoleophilaceae bacterium]|jgi:predicted DNA-binding protein (UPF0251 family)